MQCAGCVQDARESDEGMSVYSFLFASVWQNKWREMKQNHIINSNTCISRRRRTFQPIHHIEANVGVGWNGGCLKQWRTFAQWFCLTRVLQVYKFKFVCQRWTYKQNKTPRIPQVILNVYRNAQSEQKNTNIIILVVEQTFALLNQKLSQY